MEKVTTVDELKNIVNDANKDDALIKLNNYEPNAYLTDYTADQNDIPEQSPLIFDEEFDKVLFQLEPYKVSDVITLREDNPYMFVVVYPTNISVKKYESLKQLVNEKITLFQ
jgi:hypothetical protein